MDKLTVYESHLLAPPSTPYRLHQWLWQQIAPNGVSKKRDFLFRAVETDGRWLTHIRMATPNTNLPLTPKSYDLRHGIRYRFELTTVPVERSGRKTTRILRGESAIPWLEQRAHRGGFRLVEVCTAVSQPLVFYGRNGRRITLNDTLFEGILEVDNSINFTTSMTLGIGRHKGFGFGLIQINEE